LSKLTLYPAEHHYLGKNAVELILA